MKLVELIEYFEKFAPLELAEKWDNTGLQIGNLNQNISKVLIALDIHPALISEAKKNQTELIVTHHPFIYPYFKKIDLGSWQGEIISQLIKNDISFYTLHTNLDAAEKGLNVIWSNDLELNNIKPLIEHPNQLSFPGLIGEISTPTNGKNIITKIQKAWKLSNIKYAGHLDNMVKTIAICSGAGGSFLEQAINLGCDLFISGDLGYNKLQLADRHNIIIIDVGHFTSENHLFSKAMTSFNKTIPDITFIQSTTSLNPEQWWSS